ncbi:class I SAM-dependent methyltransferase [Acidovorax sp. FJL06]|uniref:class I SAM-dependent methyltransferase n=1 Tax=Acidovorax sp. FJL06 TaxID=2153365 RepID=UPI001F168BFA|nr:class I SAM-dependent methyltransferase [Acidovorax sp. FJL06]
MTEYHLRSACEPAVQGQSPGHMPPELVDNQLALKLDSTWGDPESWVANGGHWTDLEDVRTCINQRVTGCPDTSPLAWFFRTVGASRTRPLRRALVVGCGTGQLEREIARAGWVEKIVASDLSAKALALARKQAVEWPFIEYVQADMNQIPVGTDPFLPGSFDAVLGVSSVHHCSELEHLYESLAVLLKPSGWLFLDEYVGPDRFQWSNEQLGFINRLADLLPEQLMTTLSGQLKRNFRAPTVEEVIAVDPSEAVCSSNLLPLVGRYFQLVEVRPYGGALLHLLLAETAQNFASESASLYRQCVIAAEEELYRAGRLAHDFACVIARAPA